MACKVAPKKPAAPVKKSSGRKEGRRREEETSIWKEEVNIYITPFL